MSKAKIRRCTNNTCDGVMVLTAVIGDIPQWECMNCEAEDETASQYESSVKVYTGDLGQLDDVKTSFDEFCEAHTEQIK
jgi:hypothetical protein